MPGKLLRYISYITCEVSRALVSAESLGRVIFGFPGLLIGIWSKSQYALFQTNRQNKLYFRPKWPKAPPNIRKNRLKTTPVSFGAAYTYRYIAFIRKYPWACLPFRLIYSSFDTLFQATVEDNPAGVEWIKLVPRSNRFD